MIVYSLYFISKPGRHFNFIIWRIYYFSCNFSQIHYDIDYEMKHYLFTMK